MAEFVSLTDEEKIRSIDADALMAQPMARTRFFVEGLIAEGVTLLCGAPKVGKSWLALWLAMRVARGEKVWDCATRKVEVLYLCLEDTLNRVRTRLSVLTDAPPETLHIATACRSIGQGLDTQLAYFLVDHPNTELIIIDTLQKVRTKRERDSNLYGGDYADISAIKSIADTAGIAVVLIHHLRKMADTSDPFNMISGSTGLTGAVDASLILKKDDRGDDCAELIATGRDIEYQSFRLRFQNAVWNMEEHRGQHELLEETLPDELLYVCKLIEKQEKFVGTVSELCAALNALGARANERKLVRILADNARGYLKEVQIEYYSYRRAQGRIVELCRRKEQTPAPQADKGDLDFT